MLVRDQLVGGGFKGSQFPSITGIFGGFAERVGKPEDWGKVPLSVAQKHWPDKLPLRVTFDTRARIDAAVGAGSGKRLRALRITTRALTMMMKELGPHLDPTVSLTLVMETINGMAKTAPMTEKAIDEPSRAMREAQHDVIKIEHRSPTRPKVLDDPE